MNTEFYYPESLTGAQLDSFLEAGWYRMHQGLFTTHFINLEQGLFRVFWLRYNLQEFSAGSTIKKIISANKKFSVLIKPFVITDEIEALYEHYKSAVDFEGAASVTGWLYNDEENANVFDSYIVEIRDGSQLIAAGIFDNGNNSIAGIINFYHPDYKKYSLGKYLMIVKMQYALNAGKLWYYPGYIVHNYPKFDYKTFAGTAYCEIFIPGTEKWYRYNKHLVALIADKSFTTDEEK